MKTCGTCRWYHLDPKNLKQGHCHRYPPAAQGFPANNGRVIEVSTVPLVNVAYGCGEHQARIVEGAGALGAA